MSDDARLHRGLYAIGDPIYYEDAFRDVLMDHKQRILNRQGTSKISVTQQEADKYLGDFYGLMKHKGQPVETLWLVMMLNGLTSYGDYDADMLEIIVPDSQYIDRLISIHNTIHQ